MCDRDWCKFDRENFIFVYFSTEWRDMLNIDELIVDNSTQMYLEKINVLLDNYATLKRIDMYKMYMYKSKHWITLGLQKSISLKNELLAKFINKKEHIYWQRKSTLNTKTTKLSQLAITCSKTTIETLEQGVKYVQS